MADSEFLRAKRRGQRLADLEARHAALADHDLARAYGYGHDEEDGLEYIVSAMQVRRAVQQQVQSQLNERKAVRDLKATLAVLKRERGSNALRSEQQRLLEEIRREIRAAGEDEEHSRLLQVMAIHRANTTNQRRLDQDLADGLDQDLADEGDSSMSSYLFLHH